MSPENRKHRGPDPRDLTLFTENQIRLMQQAANDYLWLINRGYPLNATLKLTGDRYKLHQRQRIAIARSICPDNQINLLNEKFCKPEDIKEQAVYIDGFNTIITLEALLSNAPVLICRDHTLRDLSGVHGSYRKISETPDVIKLTAMALKLLKPASINWFFDRPVSNSGRLAEMVRNTGKEENIEWECHTTDNTDQLLIQQQGIIITSDSGIMLKCDKWFNLTFYIKETFSLKGWFIDLLKTQSLQ